MTFLSHSVQVKTRKLNKETVSAFQDSKVNLTSQIYERPEHLARILLEQTWGAQTGAVEVKTQDCPQVTHTGTLHCTRATAQRHAVAQPWLRDSGVGVSVDASAPGALATSAHLGNTLMFVQRWQEAHPQVLEGAQSLSPQGTLGLVARLHASGPPSTHQEAPILPPERAHVWQGRASSTGQAGVPSSPGRRTASCCHGSGGAP